MILFIMILFDEFNSCFNNCYRKYNNDGVNLILKYDYKLLNGKNNFEE